MSWKKTERICERVGIKEYFDDKVMLQIGRDCVDRLTEIWRRTPELTPKVTYKIECQNGQYGRAVRKVSEKAFEKRWPDFWNRKGLTDGMFIEFNHPAASDRILLVIESIDILQLQYFDPSGEIDGSTVGYAKIVLNELAGIARRDPALF